MNHRYTQYNLNLFKLNFWQLIIISIKLEHLRKDNQLLRTEINDARTKLILRDNLIKDLQDQLNNDPKRIKQNVNEELKVIIK